MIKVWKPDSRVRDEILGCHSFVLPGCSVDWSQIKANWLCYRWVVEEALVHWPFRVIFYSLQKSAACSTAYQPGSRLV